MKPSRNLDHRRELVPARFLGARTGDSRALALVCRLVGQCLKMGTKKKRRGDEIQRLLQFKVQWCQCTLAIATAFGTFSIQSSSKGIAKTQTKGRRERKRKGKEERVRFPAGAFAIFFPFLPKLHFQFPFPLSLPLSFPSSFFPFLFLSLRPFVCALKSHSSHLSL